MWYFIAESQLEAQSETGSQGHYASSCMLLQQWLLWTLTTEALKALAQGANPRRSGKATALEGNAATPSASMSVLYGLRCSQLFAVQGFWCQTGYHSKPLCHGVPQIQ